MKKAIGTIVIILIIVGIIYFNRYTVVRTFDIDGYLFTSENITINLVNGHDVSKKSINYSGVKYDQLLYKGNGKYYIGKRKKINVNMDYPVVSNNSDTLLILNDTSKLVDDKYRRTNAYANSFLSDNKLFNESDYERADNINYIFVELKNSIFANLSEIELTKNNKKYIIPVNSFIMFYDTGLRYYYLDGGKYKYNEIKGLTKETTIQFNNEKCNYIQLLERLGLFLSEEELPEIDIAPIIEEVKNGDGDNKTTELEDIKYVKPEVHFSGQKANIYSFTGQLDIKDPTSQIVKYPTFEFWIDKTMYVRKTFTNNGTIEVKGLLPDTEYEVIGTFNFKNENNQEVKSEFTRFKIKTNDISDVEHVLMNVDDIEVTYNSAKFKNVKFNNEANDEVLKGIKKIVLNVGNNNFQLGVGLVKKLYGLESIDYETSKSLSSNTKYDATFEVYDVAGNKLIVDGADYSFKTIKQAPTGSLNIKAREINKVTVKFSINNKDDINIKNMYYELYDINKDLVRKVDVDELEVVIDQLDANEVYSLNLYGSYDLEDGNGIQKNKLILEGKFTTEPISTLGYVKINYTDISATTDSITYNISLSDDVNTKLKALLSGLEFSLKDSETNEVIDNIKLNDEQFNSLINGGKIQFTSDNLKSNHAYYFDLVSYVRLGRKKYDIKTICNVNNIKTLKLDAEVLVVNKFVTKDMIDFDVSILDVDNAIESTRVLFEVRNISGILVYYDELGINDGYKHISLNKLNNEQAYTFTYKVEEYNIGHDNTTFETDYTLYQEKIITEDGLSGSIAIEDLLKQITSKNIFDLSNTSRWKFGGTVSYQRRKINKDENTISLAAKNGYGTYAYYLPEYKNKRVTVSFKIKYLDDNNGAVYLCEHGNNNCQTAAYKINGIRKGEWVSYSRSMTINNGSPYIGFTIVEVNGNNNVTTIVLKDLQIELGNEATSYVPYTEKNNYMGTFITNLVDKNHEIPKEKFYYYLRYFEDDKLIDTVKFDFNDNYEVIDAISKHEVVPNKNYNIKLSIKKKIDEGSIDELDDVDTDGYRFYDLDNINFDSKDEIRTIRTYAELLAVHITGTYLVADDISARDQRSAIGIAFNGTIDFQGHRLDMDSHYNNAYNTKSIGYIFNTIGSKGVIRNVDLHYYFDGDFDRNEVNGLAYYQYGLIENIMVTIEQDNHKPNSIISFVARENYGQIRNFVIYLKDSVSIVRDGALVVFNNYGTIMNGYLYGKAIDAAYRNPDIETTYKSIGVVAKNCGSNSYIANIYSLIDVDLYEGADRETRQWQVGNIMYSGRSILRNIYTNSSGMNRRMDIDVNIPYYYGLGSDNSNQPNVNISNVYYATLDLYLPTYKKSTKISPNALRNVGFQNMLNADNAFDIENFVKYGYYPHLKWPDVMPNQEYIAFPSGDDTAIDYLNIQDKQEFDDETVEATLVFQNPGYDTITKLEVSGVDCTILSQDDSANKSMVRVKFSNPTTYKSNYSLLKIRHKDAMGNIGAPIEYNENDRNIELDMYKNIYTVNDFKTIGTTGNYKLQADLDFNNINHYINSFSGKLDGNNHTISNIREVNRNFINTLSGGTIKNLYVDNYVRDGNSGPSGFIGTASGNCNITNVHLKNISIIDGGNSVGGFVGKTSDALISNSSTSNVNINTTNKDNFIYDTAYGGFVGENNNTIIQNCFVQGLKMNVTTSLSTRGLGGFVGRHNSGYLQDSYAVGYIKTNQQEVGGIAGYNSAYIQRVVSMVDIFTQQDSLGGIAGFSTNGSISNTLAIGGVYTGKSAVNIGRSMGNRPAAVANYAWANQLLDGVNQTAYNGDILLTSDELKSDVTYTAFIGREFDLSHLYNDKGRNLIPKLKYLSSDELLPNQVDNEFYLSDFRIDNVVSTKSVTDATLQITINNPENYEITDLHIEGLKIVRVNKNINTGDGKTFYEVYTTPEKYYDSYLIDKITYLKDGEEFSFNPSTKVVLLFYKDLRTFEDWQKISTDSYENYRLVNDIDFAGKRNIKTGILINKLEGTDDGHTIKNVDISITNGGLIDTLACNMQKVNFENITINNTSNLAYVGIIRFLNGNMADVNFRNISITGKGTAVGIVSYNQGQDIRRVNLDTINVKNSSSANFTSGFIAYSRYFDISYVNGQHMNITSSGSYDGGIVGYIIESLSSPSVYNITVDDVTIKGVSYVGSVFGRGAGTYVSATNVTVSGSSYIGGIGGTVSVVYPRYAYIADSTITGVGSYIGGVYGSVNDYAYAYAIRVNVIGTRANSNNWVGGLFGSASSYTKSYCGIKDSNVENFGNYTGGLIGTMSNGTLSYSYIYNTTVTGNNFVGGMVSKNSGSQRISYCTSNATVWAKGDYAGGIHAELNINNTTASLNKTYIQQNILAGSKITSNGAHAGAISGKTSTVRYPYEGDYKYNFVQANIITNGGELYGFFLGNDTSDMINTSKLLTLSAYENSTYNGVKVSTMTDKPANVTFYSAEEMRNKQTFVTALYNSFNFTSVENGKYPFINHGHNWQGTTIQYFDLPTGTETSGTGRKVGSFPEINVYASDVDKINVEFSKVDRNVSFKINNNTYTLDRYTYTFYYDFKDDFAIDIFDAFDSKSIIIKADDVRNSSSVNGNNYYYIDGNDITTNKGTVSVDKMSNNTNKKYRVLRLADEVDEKNKSNTKTPVNVFDNKVLLSNKDVYDADTKTIRANDFENLTIADDTSLYSFKYGDNEIETYYNYSIVNGEVISKQVFVRDDKLEVLDSTLNSVKDSTLIDQYNGKSYVIYLGIDGKLHSLKDDIKMPRRFKNSNIKSISTDMYNDSDIVFVLYENGDYIVFNYLTGKVIEEKMSSNKDLVSYFTSYFTNTRVTNKKSKKYNESEKLISKINKKGISEVLGSENDNSKTKVNGNYTAIYNPVTENYEIYRLPNVDGLSSSISGGVRREGLDEVLTRTSTSNKINNNLVLYNYYIGDGERKKTILISVLLIVSAIIIGISGATLLLKRNLRKN